MDTFEFHDRYTALGIPRPDPATICPGACEGTGWVPVHIRDLVGANPQFCLDYEPAALKRAWEDHQYWLDHHPRALRCTDEPTARNHQYRWLWMAAHYENCGWGARLRVLRQNAPRDWVDAWSQFRYGCDGWHFCRCLDCGGTGKRPVEGSAPNAE